jgi:hypothetical protein
MMRLALGLIVVSIVAPTGFPQSTPSSGHAETTAQQVFEQRIIPIFKSPSPSSCIQCHLAGVDLKDYIRPSQEQTFASLRDQGLIDMKNPERSRILALIKMGQDEKGGAALIQQKVRKAEYEAFAEWIKRSVADPKMRELPKSKPEELAKPARSDEVIRYERTDRLVESFANNIWPLRFRCMGCHSEGTAENKKRVAEYGERVAWFKSGGPKATLDYLRTAKLINIDEPEQSLLLLKPLNAVKHGGGLKIVKGDQGYKAIRAFVEDYARIVKNQYADAASLPRKAVEPARFGTDIWLKLAETPSEWGDKLLQVTLFAWDTTKGDWESEPIATSDRGVFGKGKLWQHNLTLLAAKGSERALTWRRSKPSLPRGRYLVKIYVDQNEKLKKDWHSVLDREEFVGQIEVRSGWPEGYGQMTVVDAANTRP